MATYEPGRAGEPFAGISEPDVEELLEIEAEEIDRRRARDVIASGARTAAEWDDEPEDLGRAVGRLGVPGSDDDAPRDFDDEGDAVAWSTEDDDLSAEESAVHITYEPGFDADDGYVQ
jgi:hypothetical protein